MILTFRYAFCSQFGKEIEGVKVRQAASKGMAELLVGAAGRHPPYAELVRSSHRQVGEMAQKAMSHAVAGNPLAAIKALITHSEQTLNTKLMDTARLTLQRYRDKLPEANELEEMVQAQLRRYSPSSQPPPLGQPTGRSEGGISLRTAAEKATQVEDNAEVANHEDAE